MDASATSVDDPPALSEWVEVRAGAAHLSAGVWAGLLSGLVIGGLGGRLAMFILRLTSDPSLSGLDTDDGFKIGIVSGSTIFLVAICTVLGVVGGVLYLAARGWIPKEYRAACTAVVAGAVGAALVIKPEGIDFNRVEPLALSIPFFIIIPVLYGWAVSALTERLLRRKERVGTMSAVSGFLPLIGLALLGPIGVIVIAGSFVAWTVNRRFPVAAALWHSPAVTWTGRAALAVVTAFSLVALISDVIEIV